MPCIDDRSNGIVLNHDPGWTGDVRLAWYNADERCELAPPPRSLRECWCSGPDLVAGLFTPVSGPPGIPSATPAVDIITRAVALAVESYLRHKLAHLVDTDLVIRRDRLWQPEQPRPRPTRTREETP